MTLNPFIILLAIYSTANTYALFQLLINGGFNSFGIFYQIETTSSIIAYLLQAFSLIFISIFYFGGQQAYKKYHKKIQLDDSYGYFLIAVTIAFFFFNQITGAGRAGSDFSFGESNLLNYIFVLIQPDLWFFLIAPFVRSNRIFFIASSLFFISLTSRGWMGSVLLLGCVLLVRFYPIKIGAKNSTIALTLLLLIIASLPALDALKWGMRLGLPLNIVIESLFEKDYLELFFIVLDSVISRLQNLNYVAFSVQNYDSIYASLNSGRMNWFFQSGIFNSIYCKLNNCGADAGIYLAEMLTGQHGLTWNVDLGFSGWIAALNLLFPTFLIFSSLLLIGGNFFGGILFGQKGILLFGTFSLIYLFHGWLTPFVNLVIYSSVFYFVFYPKLRARIN